MLTGMHVAIIGGDARQLEVIRKLVELDAKLSLVGFDQLAHHFTGATKMSIEEVDFADLDAIILPVHGTTLDGKVNSVFSHEPIPFTEEMVQKNSQAVHRLFRHQQLVFRRTDEKDRAQIHPAV